MTRSYKQLLGQIAKLQMEAERIRSLEVAGVIERIKAAIEHYQLTAADLFGGEPLSRSRPLSARKSGVGSEKSVAKFGDAEGRTWSGRGRRPAWYVQALASGLDEDQLLLNPISEKRNNRVKLGKKKATIAVGVPKFRSVDGETWTGRGKRPAWFVAAIESGQSPNDLLIKTA